ncbi:hypothetical protein CsSME_00001211 [Camellia sinensis var. sinensis]
MSPEAQLFRERGRERERENFISNEALKKKIKRGFLKQATQTFRKRRGKKIVDSAVNEKSFISFFLSS